MGEKTKATNKAIIDFSVESRPDIVFISVTIARYLFYWKRIEISYLNKRYLFICSKGETKWLIILIRQY